MFKGETHRDIFQLETKCIATKAMQYRHEVMLVTSSTTLLDGVAKNTENYSGNFQKVAL